jgi:phosphohistidine swiveling domain-containing protein/nucleoside-diphosphate-sugar epimerase
MRVVLAGAGGPVGLGVAARLVSLGHDVVGVGPQRPESWPGRAVFVELDTTDDATLAFAFVGADAAAHLDADAGEAAVVTRTALESGVPRVVVTTDVADAGVIVVRHATLLGRTVDDATLREFTPPVIRTGSADTPLYVVHPEDVQRVVVRALLDASLPAGSVDVAAPGYTSVRAIAHAIGRRVRGGPRRPPSPTRDSTRVTEWDVAPAWTAEQCVEDFALACRGRITLGDKLLAFPWRLPRVRTIPSPEAPSADGVAPEPAGNGPTNGEFDTPIDPRFPAFIATNLSEALAGPFTPSSASVSVLGTRAAGMVIAERLRPGGAVQREMAVRTTGVFGHRLYAGMTSGYFMATTVPLVKPDMILSGFFGRTADGLELFGAERPPVEPQTVGRFLRAVVTFANNLLVLSAGSKIDSRDFVADVARLEELATEPKELDDRELRTLILLGRDHAVHGWVLASASILVCTAYGVILRLLCGREVLPSTGPELASAQSLGAVHRLAAAARADATAAELLATAGVTFDELSRQAPEFAAAFRRELALIGHRGPGEVEMRSTTYADDPSLLMRIVAKAAAAGPRDAPAPPDIPLWVRPIAAAAATQLREREVRRDRMVRAIWVVRTMLREAGRRLVDEGVLGTVDDVFYLQVDELESPPPDIASVVARRRDQQRTLTEMVPPEAFSGHWDPQPAAMAPLAAGEVLHGMGVGDGKVTGRVRVIAPETIGELQPGEVLVAKVTDVGYTPAFAYAAAVVTELGGPISHAAIVAREFGVPCVVNARGAATRLPTGTLIEVDGTTGTVTVLDE